MAIRRNAERGHNGWAGSSGPHDPGWFQGDQTHWAGRVCDSSKLTVFQNQDPQSKVPPIEIEGTFLFGTRGDVSQIDPEHNLIWWGTALDVRDQLSEMFEERDE